MAVEVETMSKPEILDFNRLYSDDISNLLAKLGEMLIKRLFSADERPRLSEFEGILNKYRKQWAGSYIRQLNSQYPRTGKESENATIWSKESAGQWRENFEDAMVKRLNGKPGTGLPDSMWPPAERRAWQGLELPLLVSMEISTHLREKVICAPGYIPAVTLSPRTIWALLLLVKVKEKNNENGKVRSKPVDKIWQALSGMGKIRVLTEGWAGFWDQCIIGLALRKWKLDDDEKDTRFILSLLELPVVKKEVHLLFPPDVPGKQVPVVKKKWTFSLIIKKLVEFIKRVYSWLKKSKKREQEKERETPIAMAAAESKTILPAFLDGMTNPLTFRTGTDVLNPIKENQNEGVR
jgi:hypothetical protein